MSMTVGEKIREYRLKKHMTQEQLGKHLGVGKAAVQKYESGQVQNLKATHIKTLCKLFDKKPWDFIFDGDERPNPPTHYQQKIIKQMTKLNDRGLDRLLIYTYDLLKIDEYRK